MFVAGDTLKGWDIVPRLHQITKESLLINSGWDTSTDSCNEPYFQRIAKVQWVTLSECDHMAWFSGEEQRARCLRVVQEFLAVGVEANEAHQRLTL